MLNSVEDIITLMMCHAIGDYVLQSDFIATTKGQNWYHLFIHSILYTIPFYIYFHFSWKIMVTIISHIIIDALKARYNKINYIEDQIFHYFIGLLYIL